MEKGFHGQARAGWSRWDIRINMMENYNFQVVPSWKTTLSPVSWAMGTEVSEKSQLRDLV